MLDLPKIRREIKEAIAAGPQPGMVAIGYPAGCTLPLVILECKTCAAQHTVNKKDYFAGKYDGKIDPTHAHALALADECERLRELFGKCRSWVSLGCEYQNSEAEARGLLHKIDALTKVEQ